MSTMMNLLNNGNLLPHADQSFLWSTVVLARIGEYFGGGDRRRRPFSPYLGEGLLIVAVGATLGDIFYRHTPFSTAYLFDLGVFLIGLALTANSYKVIPKWAIVIIVFVGGAATVGSFLPL